MVIPFIPFLPPHENAYGENMQKHTVKPPLLLPNGGFTRAPEGSSSCRRVPPGAAGRAQNAPRNAWKNKVQKSRAKGRPKGGQKTPKGAPKRGREDHFDLPAAGPEKNAKKSKNYSLEPLKT